MRYPTPAEYQEALQHPESAFRDPGLQRAVPEQSVLGLPVAITGSFAVVFPVQADDALLAVRCFLSDAGSQAARYGALQNHLEKHPHPSFVGFEFQREGVTVHGRWWPVVKMAWAGGKPINAFVEEHLGNSELLETLAGEWRRVVQSLADAEMAHGDLQHGNILVELDDAGGTPRIRLVDYDSVFVPKLKGRAATEIGHRNFQHPDRTEAEFDLHVDRFPSAIIYTALRACAAAPELWKRYDNGENLLFKADDFYDPAGSPLFKDLRRIDDIQPLARALHEMCSGDYAELPDLEEVLSGWRGETWARQKRAPGEEREKRAVRRPPWMTPVLALWAIACGSLLASGYVVPALVVFLLGAGALGYYLLARHLRHPDRRRRHRLEREIALLQETIHRLEGELKSLEADAEAIRNERENRRAARLAEIRDQQLRDHLKYHYVAELEAVEGIDHRAVVCLKSQAIRTAWHANPDRIGQAAKLAPETKARINMWRAALVNQYRPGLPEKLSAGEEKRLKRFERTRLAEIEKEAEQSGHRLDFQREELAELEKRLREI